MKKTAFVLLLATLGFLDSLRAEITYIDLIGEFTFEADPGPLVSRLTGSREQGAMGTLDILPGDKATYVMVAGEGMLKCRGHANFIQNFLTLSLRCLLVSKSASSEGGEESEAAIKLRLHVDFRGVQNAPKLGQFEAAVGMAYPEETLWQPMRFRLLNPYW